MKKVFKLFLVLALVFSMAGEGAFAAKKPDAKKKELTDQEKYQLLEMFANVLELTQREYVDEVDVKKLIEYALDGMLSSLDPHSGFMNAESFTDLKTQTSGKFGGLGIEVSDDQGWVRIVSPMDDTPAYEAGLQPGDYITHIDGVSVLGLGLSEAVKRMRGEVGKSVTLTIRRKGMDAFDVKLKRAVISVTAVKSEAKGDIGYLRISSFNEDTTTMALKEMEKLKKKMGGKAPKGYILDLRNNPGGLLDQAIGISDIFIDKGEIVSTRSRRPEDIRRSFASQEGKLAGDLTGGAPVVVLINGGSASASEIVAGALQDHKRAVIVGTRSYGKGSVQTVMSAGGPYGIRLTTSRYYTPSGSSIQAKGITPDIEIRPAKIEEAPDSYVRGAGEAELYNALDNGNGNEERDPFTDKEQAEAEKNVDYQLERAIDILKGMVVYSQREK